MPRINADNLADHRALTWAALLKGLDQLLAERDYDQITLADITARAGIARSTVYNYASDKAALLAASVAESATALIEHVETVAHDLQQPAAVRLGTIINDLLATFGEGTWRIFALQVHLGSVPAKERALAAVPMHNLQSSIAFVISDGIERGEFRPSDDIDIDLALLSALMEGAVRRIASHPESSAKIRAHTACLVLHSLKCSC